MFDWFDWFDWEAIINGITSNFFWSILILPLLAVIYSILRKCIRLPNIKKPTHKNASSPWLEGFMIGSSLRNAPIKLLIIFFVGLVYSGVLLLGLSEIAMALEYSAFLPFSLASERRGDLFWCSVILTTYLLGIGFFIGKKFYRLEKAIISSYIQTISSVAIVGFFNLVMLFYSALTDGWRYNPNFFIDLLIFMIIHPFLVFEITKNQR